MSVLAQPIDSLQEDLAAPARALAGQRVVMLTNWFQPSSVAWITADYCRAARQLGAEVEAWAFSHDGPVGDALRREGFTVRVLGVPRHGWRWRTTRALADALRDGGRYDWVHAHCYEPALHAARVLDGHGPRLLVSVHDSRIRTLRRLMMRPYRLLPATVITPSAGVAGPVARWFGFPHARMLTIPYPVAEEWFEPVARDDDLAVELGLDGAYPVLMWVARLQRQKGHADLIRALPEVLRRHPSARLVLVGGGRHEPALRRLVRRLGLTHAVVFTGPRSDVRRLVGLADIFVCPSHLESCCKSVQEALAAGKPVVSTAVWGPSEYIDDGRTGLLAPIGRPGALAGAILRLADDLSEAATLGAAAREYARAHFTVESFERGVLDAYLRAGA